MNSLKKSYDDPNKREKILEKFGAEFSENTIKDWVKQKEFKTTEYNNSSVLLKQKFVVADIGNYKEGKGWTWPTLNFIPKNKDYFSKDELNYLIENIKYKYNSSDYQSENSQQNDIMEMEEGGRNTRLFEYEEENKKVDDIYIDPPFDLKLRDKDNSASQPDDDPIYESEMNEEKKVENKKRRRRSTPNLNQRLGIEYFQKSKPKRLYDKMNFRYEKAIVVVKKYKPVPKDDSHLKKPQEEYKLKSVDIVQSGENETPLTENQGDTTEMLAEYYSNTESEHQ